MASALKTDGLAVVIGSGGGLGAAMLAQLKTDENFAQAIGYSRSTEVSLNRSEERRVGKECRP